MEPLSTLEDLVEVKLFRACLSDGRVCTVVDDLAGSHGGSRLSVVDAHALTATYDVACADTIAAHGVEGKLSDFVLREFGDKVGIVAVVGEADGHVGLTTSGDDTKVITLYESVVAFWRSV